MRTLMLALFLVACVGNPVQPGPSAPAPTTNAEPDAPPPAEPDAPPPPDRQILPPEPPIPADPGPPSVMPDPAPRTAAPLRSAPASLYTCTTDADCVIECDLPGNCCGAPCGCRTAVNKHVLAELKQVPWYQCTREDARECPAVGCAYEPANSASCSSGRCVASDH